MIMAKKSSRRVHLGDPEHIISPEQARKMLSNQLKYRPEDTTAPHIDHGTIPVIGDKNVLDTEKFKSTYNLDFEVCLYVIILISIHLRICHLDHKMNN